MASRAGIGLILREVEGDLFQCSRDSSLAHCISADVHMGKGIAKIFKQTFGGVRDLRRQDKWIGEVSVLNRQGRYIYYLITKPRFFDKPTYDTLRASLTAMRRHCQEYEVKKLAIPKIGCGLDKLEWPYVKEIIHETFKDTELEITVYSLPEYFTAP